MNLRAISYVDLLPLFPEVAPKEVTLVDLLPKPKKNDSIGNLLNNIRKINDIYFLLKYGKAAFLENSPNQKSKLDYGKYLQFPNAKIKALAMSIVKPSDSDDVKAWKLLCWVQDNIQYVSDIKNYRMNEYWALPVISLAKRSGDCEDGAFLLASLELNAGVDPNRVRVYGGFVSAGTNASTGGHAWGTFKRTIDNQWVSMDWCYYATKMSINERPTLEKDMKYLDDYFYVTAFGTVDTTYMNTIRDILHPLDANVESAVRTKITRDLLPLLKDRRITLQPGSIVDATDTAHVGDISYPFVGYGVSLSQPGSLVGIRA